ncbi:MAG TPA: hypothetical protein LFW20_07470 [Rickettsia endosymbiont of Omalisus fontisbellaquei]|nr:hypothetical protein [Rickettsia endosymbiont of Omalisus fontisbellaquei]
MDTVVKPRYDT